MSGNRRLCSQDLYQADSDEFPTDVDPSNGSRRKPTLYLDRGRVTYLESHLGKCYAND